MITDEEIWEHKMELQNDEAPTRAPLFGKGPFWAEAKEINKDDHASESYDEDGE